MRAGERLDKIERRQSSALQKLQEGQLAASTAAQTELASAAKRTRLLWAVTGGALVLAVAAMLVALLVH